MKNLIEKVLYLEMHKRLDLTLINMISVCLILVVLITLFTHLLTITSKVSQNKKKKVTKDNSHKYHLVDPSPWPVLASSGIFMLTLGLVSWMQHFTGNFLLIINGIFLINGIASLWWRDVIREASFEDQHSTPVIYGPWMFLFIVSEIMFFFMFFGGFFHSSLSPVHNLGSIWPPKFIIPTSWVNGIPLTNAFLTDLKPFFTIQLTSCEATLPAEVCVPLEESNHADISWWCKRCLGYSCTVYTLVRLGLPLSLSSVLSLIVFIPFPEPTHVVIPKIDPNSLPSYSAIGEGKTTGVLFGNAGVAALVHLHRNAMVSFFVLSGIREFTDWPVAPAILITWFIFTIFNQWENINATGFACSAKDTEQATSETPSNTTSKASDVTANFIIIPSPIGDLNNQSIEKQKAEFREKRRISEEAIKKQKTLNLTEVDEDLPPTKNRDSY